MAGKAHSKLSSQGGAGGWGAGAVFSGRGDDHTTFFPGKVHEMQIIPQVAESMPGFPLDNSDHGDEGREAQSKYGG